MALVVEGYTNRAIAKQLGFSVGTINLVLHQLTGKLGVRDRVGAAVLAARCGLVGPGEPQPPRPGDPR
jgi:DNA-binding NarL/FixJ family response regulator